MTGSEIYLKLKGIFEDRISIPVSKMMGTLSSTAKDAGKMLGGIGKGFSNHISPDW